MRVALIKTSSMGDVIHALPVVTDIVAARPDVRVDWVVEESFAELPRLHPAVGEVVSVAVRRWRRSPGRRATWAEIAAVRARLRAARYDLALDLQGLVKSAVVARWTGAPVAGFSRECAREPLAALAYARRYAVDPQSHAIERLRSLAAQALGYRAEGGPRFGLVAPARPLPWLPSRPFVAMLHATSRAEKLWPAERWRALGAALHAAGLASVWPWGSAAERDAAQALAAGVAGAVVAPKLALGECARLLADARAVVGVDTGLTHLAAALETRTVALFGATEAWRYGPYWTHRALNLGDAGRWPDEDAVVQALDELGAFGPDDEAREVTTGASRSAGPYARRDVD